MLKWKLICWLMIGLTTGVSAQKINISQQLDGGGRARSSFFEWAKPGSQPLSLVIQYQTKSLIEEQKMYLFIDKKTELHEFIEFDTYKIEVADSVKSIHKRVSFQELGDYVIAFTNADKEIIISDTLKIRGTNKVFFCEQVKGKKFLGIKDEYQLTSTGLCYYKVVLQGQESFGTHQFKINIYQHDGEGFNTLIGKYKQLVHPNRKKTSYGGPFLDAGKYKVEVFKFNGEPFAEAYLNLVPYQKEEKSE